MYWIDYQSIIRGNSQAGAETPEADVKAGFQVAQSVQPEDAEERDCKVGLNKAYRQSRIVLNCYAELFGERGHASHGIEYSKG